MYVLYGLVDDREIHFSMTSQSWLDSPLQRQSNEMFIPFGARPISMKLVQTEELFKHLLQVR